MMLHVAAGGATNKDTGSAPPTSPGRSPSVGHDSPPTNK
jgi:hypothetical protein